MHSWVTELIRSLVGVVLGWVLGLASPLIVERRKKRKRVRAIKIAVSQDLRELALRLLMVAYQAERKQGNLNRELLEWMQPLLRRYEGPNPSERLLEAVEGLLKGSDANLAALAAQECETLPPQCMPREEARYATMAAAQAHDFDPEYAKRLLDILSHLRMLNEQREDQLYYHHLTFAAGVTPENQKRAITNANTLFQFMGQRARIIVDKITAFEQKFPLP